MEVCVKERTLEILVLPNGRNYRIIAHSPSGNKEESVPQPKNIRADLVELQDALLRGAAARRGQTVGRLGAAADERMIADLGTKLYSFLFCGDIATLYRQSLQDAVSAGEKLRIKLQVHDARDLSRIPWEALYDAKTRTFLSTSLRAPFMRSVDSAELIVKKTKRLHILGMIAGPLSFRGVPLSRLDVDMERTKIDRALQSLQAEGKLTLSWTPTGSYRDFRRRLHTPDDRDEGWTIFHFIGHGDFSEELGRGFLIFEESGSAAGEARYADTLAPLLTAHGGPQLVVLNACNGARSSTGDLFSSVAATLALAEVPAVIAMQYPVSDAMAIAFSGSFYGYLGEEDYSIYDALAQTRIDLRYAGIAEWISPVLFMQSKDGDIVTF
jgi:CHAT domain-containing protein